MNCLFCNKEIDMIYKNKTYCDNKCKSKAYYYNNKGNCYKNQKDRGLVRKKELIKLCGGKCNICGYNKNIAALQFHHIEPELKSFELDMRNLSNRTWHRILEEFKKCELLCANCHAEHHNPSYQI